ncbi:polysaccharide deacetylase family protein [Nocardioides sp. TRM66260-LWL]|uniref:polysaccharide deacetylase family protein n=1 Tax=Nocardioides sp. TRM66260-LWL TaxID=2874478 RepID=UPI001CC3DAEA|nr:polysaccharide deacetylase family protein [Nocardioides sp. TRM66260-LWL]MBZ5734382.1 polysaccharide deacetylase family protein [Nocardioides sp. TRM66260-LWL]
MKRPAVTVVTSAVVLAVLLSALLSALAAPTDAGRASGSEAAGAAPAAASAHRAPAHRARPSAHRTTGRTAPAGRPRVVAGPAIRPVGSCRAGRVALTFDDGPDPRLTPRLARLLQRLRVPATFFMVGERVDEAPAAARAVVRRGFTIGDHTYHHPVLDRLSGARVRTEIWSTAAAFRRAGLDAGVVDLVRPPYGAADARTRSVIAGMGRPSVLWNVDSRDWAGLSPAAIVRTVVREVRANGRRDSIVLHHDGVTNSPATLAAVPREVHRLRRLGFCFVALDAQGRPARR